MSLLIAGFLTRHEEEEMGFDRQEPLINLQLHFGAFVEVDPPGDQEFLVNFGDSRGFGKGRQSRRNTGLVSSTWSTGLAYEWRME